MADFFVDSGGSNTDPYDTWAKAATSMATVDGEASAGDNVYVEYRFSELPAASTTHNFAGGTWTNPIKLYSVDKDDSDALRFGAVLGCADSDWYQYNIQGNLIIWGVHFKHWILGFGAASQRLVGYNCTFEHNRSNATNGLSFANGTLGSPAESILESCTFDQSGESTWTPLSVSYWNRTCIKNSTIVAATTTNTEFISVETDGSDVEIIGADLSDFTNLCDCDASRVVFRGCEVAATTSPSTNTPNKTGTVLVESCNNGTITDPPLGLRHFESYQGEVESDSDAYRDDGAVANSENYSWKMTSNTNAEEVFRPLEAPKITLFNKVTGSQTLTLHVAHNGVGDGTGGRLQDDEFWIEVESPSEEGSATAKVKWQTTRMAVNGSPADLTESTKDWTGSLVGTKDKIEVSLNPTIKGPIIVKCCLAISAGATVHICPKLELA